jgi:HSP20 family protein
MNSTVTIGSQCSGPRLQPAGDESDIDRIFQHFFSHKDLFSTIPQNVWSPPTDVYETPGGYVVRVEIPGLIQKDVEIELKHNVLTVRGHRRDHSPDVKLGFQQMEIHYGYFERVVTLPHSIDPEARSASYRDGFLRVNIGKKKAQSKTERRIHIES